MVRWSIPKSTQEEGRVGTGFIWLWCKVDISFKHILINLTNFMDAGPSGPAL